MSRKKEVDQAVADVDFDQKKYQAKIKTSEGDILLDLYGDVAPGHCKNLIGLSLGYCIKIGDVGVIKISQKLIHFFHPTFYCLVSI